MALSVSYRMVPKYRHKIPNGPIRDATYNGIQAICGYSGAEVVEMNIQNDHIHLIVMVPPKIAISDFMGRSKGQTAIKAFKQFPSLRQKPYWGNEFWSKGYCVDTIGLDEEMIRKYVKYQEQKDHYIDQLKFGFK
jgi:putative transposase